MFKYLFIVTLFFAIACNPANKQRKEFLAGIQEGVEIGNRAPELSYRNPDGDLISLSSLRGNMVLIDFWASWCPPCRKENPKVVAAYHAYKDKKFKHGEGFTVYSVSCDRTHDAWVEAIEQDSLVWKNHVSDLKGWDAEATFKYVVSYIPYNYLIDGDGVIVAKELHGDDLINTLDTLLLN